MLNRGRGFKMVLSMRAKERSELRDCAKGAKTLKDARLRVT